MNWLDIVLLGTLAVCAAVGLKLGLIKAVLVAAAVYVGGLIAGRLSGGVGDFLSGLVSMEGDIGDLLNRTIQNETILTVATYVVIIVAFLLIARLLSKMAFVLKLATMGLSSVCGPRGRTAPRAPHRRWAHQRRGPGTGRACVRNSLRRRRGGRRVGANGWSGREPRGNTGRLPARFGTLGSVRQAARQRPGLCAAQLRIRPSQVFSRR